MICLEDYVGVRSCNFAPSLSGMYIDQLPGIQVAQMDQISNAEQLTWAGVWADLQATCSDTFKEDVIAEFNKRYQLKQLTQTVDLGKQINTSSLTPTSNTSNGIMIETVATEDLQCAYSNLMRIYIQELSFYYHAETASPATITLTFQDVDNLEIEYTTTIVPVLGWNKVWIDMPFDARRLYVLVSGNFDDYVQLDISNFNLDNFGGGGLWGNTGGIWFNWYGNGCQSRVNGVTYDSATNTFVKGPNTFGVSIKFSAQCTFESIVCSNKKHFANAWRLALAIEFLNYQLNSSRLNRWTTIDKKQALELRKLFELKYRGGKDEVTGVAYPGTLKQSIESLVLNDADCCLKVNNFLIWRESQF